MSAIAWLYASGAALELAGLALVAWDVHDASTTLKAMSSPRWGYDQTEKGKQVGSLFQLMAEVSAGNLQRRGAGVALIAGGLIVQTIANVWAP